MERVGFSPPVAVMFPFPVAVVEVMEEYEARKRKLPDLQIEQTLLLNYPAPMYFWFSKTAEGRRLAGRADGFGIRP